MALRQQNCQNFSVAVIMTFDHEIESSDESSSSNDALLEMLGLTDVPTVDEMDDDCQNHDSHCIVSIIPFPNYCSRHGYMNCFGLVLENIIDTNRCRRLIDHAEACGFRYISEATHYAPDGSSYTVKIQNPNPHKLCAIDTYHCVQNTTSNKDQESIDHDNGHYLLNSSSHNHDATNLINYLYEEIHKHVMSSKIFHQFMEREKCGLPMGLNPRLRILKYDAVDNDSFQPHFDATTIVHSCHANKAVTGINENKKSLITVLLYLNSGEGVDFFGGKTKFTSYSTDKFIAGSKYKGSMKMDESSLQNYADVSPSVGRVVLFEHDMFHSGEPLLWGTKYILRTDILFRDDSNVQMNIHLNDQNEGTNTTIPKMPVDIRMPKQSQRILVSDICTELNLSHDHRQTLKNIGLYECTCDAFLAPGLGTLNVVLAESGMDRDTVQQLIEKVSLNTS